LFDSMLNENNRRWAPNAPLLMYVVAGTVAEDGRVRRTASFDTGAAWMSLALQARLMGLYAHAMGGIQRDRVYEVLGLSKDAFDVICAVAIGRRAGSEQLPEDLQERERPSGRNPIDKAASKWQL
jgi:nitroreductase